jgi:DDE superfamily endonuclease
MPTLPAEFTKLVEVFSSLFSRRVWRLVPVLLAGAILATGRRTVTALLRIMGLDQERQFQTFHRVLNRASWSSLAASRRLLLALVRAFVPHGPVVLGMDDTIERRWGKCIAARGIYRDPVRSSKGHFVKASGLRWLSVMLLAPIPWASRVWALPFLTALCPSERYYAQRHRPPKPLTDWARQLLLQVSRWLPGRTIVVVADSSFAALGLLGAVRHRLSVITRLRLDAALYEPVPARPAGQVGRPRCKGARLPALKDALANPATVWQSMTVAYWYGTGGRQVEWVSGTCVWYHPGLPVVPIRWLLVRDPHGRFDAQAFLSTDLDHTPQQMLQWFIQRWQVEVTFEESRAHLGIETQRQWSDRAIARTTPILLALYSLVTLMAQECLATGQLPVRAAAWYTKTQPTFSDTLAWVRRWLWSSQNYSMSPNNPVMIKIPRPLFERLTDAVCYAANG